MKSRDASYLSWVYLLFIYGLLFQCSQIYSPFGIRGSDAIEEIEETKTVSNAITLPFQQSATRLDFSRIDPPICSPSGNSISSSTSGASPADFTLPESGEVLDLVSNAASDHFFRSDVFPASNSDILNTLKIQTIRTEGNTQTSEDTCRYRVSQDCTGSMNTDDSGYFKILNNEPTDIDSAIQFQPGLCLKIQCNGLARVRLRNDPLAGRNAQVSTNFDVASFAFGTDLFNSLAKIQKDRYYTRASFDSCKDAVLLVSLYQASQNIGDIARFRNNRIQNRFCNDLIPRLSTQSGNIFSNLIQGGACNLKEVNLIGL